MEEPYFDPYDPDERRWHRRLLRLIYQHALFAKLACVVAAACLIEGPLARTGAEGVTFFRFGVAALFVVTLVPPVWEWWQDSLPRRTRWKEDEE
jgi:hypothetical protein